MTLDEQIEIALALIKERPDIIKNMLKDMGKWDDGDSWIPERKPNAFDEEFEIRLKDKL